MTINPSSLLEIEADDVQYFYVKALTAGDMITQVERQRLAIVTAFPGSRIVAFELAGGGNGAVFVTMLGVDTDGDALYPLMSDSSFQFVLASEPAQLVTETARVIAAANVADQALIGQSESGAGAGAIFMAGFAFANEGTIPSPVSPADTLLFGANSVFATTADRFLFPSYSDDNAMTSPVQYRLVRAGTLQGFRMRQNGPGGNGNIIDYTVRINSVSTAITVAMASTASDGSNLASSVVVAANALIDVIVEKAAAVGNAPNDVVGSLGFS